jgi:phospholipase A1
MTTLMHATDPPNLHPRTLRTRSLRDRGGTPALLAALLTLGTAAPAFALDETRLANCAALADRDARLACYDAAVGRDAAASAAAPAQGVTVPPASPPPAQPQTPPPIPQLTPGLDEAVTPTRASLFEDRWSFGNAGADGRFDLRAHRPTYLIPLRYSDAPNRSPSSPTRGAPAAPLDLRKDEAKFQISFKVRLADFGDAVGPGSGLSLWGAYTQQSQWQVYNGAVSRPFRETNYEPELILAFDPNRTLPFGWSWRLAALALDHQSNGRDDPLSRSWNRVYAQAGVERGGVGVQLRLWQRLHESQSSDDNPDIGRYMGHGDLVASWQNGRHTLSALLRDNFSSRKGAAQVGWAFPLDRRLRGTLQYFTGYGESLIDYNVRQHTIGVGVQLADWW